MTAIRSVRAAEGKFVQIANAAAQDHRLSLKARGILLYVLSLPADRTFSAAWLEAQVSEGREAVRSGLRELERYGYFRRTKKQDAHGHWVWDQVISDGPLTEEAADANGTVTSMCGFPADGIPADGKPSDKNLKTETLKHEDQKKASRRAARFAFGDESDTESIADDVRRAAVRSYGDSAAGLTDEQCIHIYRRFCCTKTGQPYRIAADVYAYLVGGPLSDVPTLAQALQPTAKRRIPASCLRRFNDREVNDDERMEIIESLTGMFGPGEIPAVEKMLMDGRPLDYIVNVVSTGQLNVAA